MAEDLYAPIIELGIPNMFFGNNNPEIQNMNQIL